MPQDSTLLQDLPCVDVQHSLYSKAKKSKKWQTYLTEDLDSECTPNELIPQWSPGPKRQRIVSKGKENDCNNFVISKRSRKRKDSQLGISWDHLPDELILKILFFLPLQDLLRTSVICRRWHRLAFDESLWQSVDLVGVTNMVPALQQVLKTGVRRLRCPHSFIDNLHFTGMCPLQMTEMDLSGSIISTRTLEGIIRHCNLLECLSLEGLQLSDNVVSGLAQNPLLRQLNLSGCSNFTPEPLAELLQTCSRLEQLNISWCIFTNNHVKSVVNHVSSTVTHLNLSGYRESLTLDDVKVLVTRCPNIHALDLSDSTQLMSDCFPVLCELKHLLHLSLSRCYHIHIAALTNLRTTFPTLHYLDVFGLVNESHLSSLRKESPGICINSLPFSAIARPTPANIIGNVGSHSMWNRKVRLRFRL
ncbi:S-phase kinase-associated protein 2 [Corythoichthys intestinalis]|uniref:S-phase kinase-associated protein 2 n=1 Tax=Corythoichthys intestinalis TaxID=161448 RepID=UPI0025A596A3|nr:S-phase kinase-associated protein 2 [Corythoichthys intestinalis]XP_061800642.1 S-phase kinase-associated protein 2-like [Nerophis lumbriciformis]